MRFQTYGDNRHKSLLFIHGLASTADLCFGPLVPYLEDYHLIFCELDGHCAAEPNDFSSMQETVEAIEHYICTALAGKVYGLCGFSMGATIAVDLIARGKFEVERVLLDAAITVELGWLALPYTWAFIIGTTRIRKGKALPEFLAKKIMGQSNHRISEIVYPQVTSQTIRKACRSIYHYKIPESLRGFSRPVLFWRGSEEPIPERSERLLKDFLPHMLTEVHQAMGHGQFLHEHPEEYAARLKQFISH